MKKGFARITDWIDYVVEFCKMKSLHLNARSCSHDTINELALDMALNHHLINVPKFK
jgi:hypothetical protein